MRLDCTELSWSSDLHSDLFTAHSRRHIGTQRCRKLRENSASRDRRLRCWRGIDRRCLGSSPVEEACREVSGYGHSCGQAGLSSCTPGRSSCEEPTQGDLVSTAGQEQGSSSRRHRSVNQETQLSGRRCACMHA